MMELIQMLYFYLIIDAQLKVDAGSSLGELHPAEENNRRATDPGFLAPLLHIRAHIVLLGLFRGDLLRTDGGVHVNKQDGDADLA